MSKRDPWGGCLLVLGVLALFTAVGAAALAVLAALLWAML